MLKMQTITRPLKKLCGTGIARHLPLLVVVALLQFASGCDKDKSPTESSDDCVRIGAVCKDGTTTDATGSGACSHHGGVDHWLCK